MRRQVDRVRRYFNASPSERFQMRRNRWTEVRKWREIWRWHRLTRGNHRIALVSNSEYLLVHVGDHIGRQVFVHGEYDLDKFELTLGLLDRSVIGTLVDVGANIGSISVPAVARGLAIRAVAIEPEPRNFALLTSNVAINSLEDRIECHQLAAGAEDDIDLELLLSEKNYGDHRIAGPEKSDLGRASLRVKSRTLDSIAPSLDPCSDLIWVDVQGFEPAVLRGSVKLLKAKVPIVLEFWPRVLAENSSVDELLKLLAPYNSFIDLGDNTLSLQPLQSLGTLWDEHLPRGTFTDLLILSDTSESVGI